MSNEQKEKKPKVITVGTCSTDTMGEKLISELEKGNELLVEPITFPNLDGIKDTITAKLLRLVAEHKGCHLLSCNISEYENAGKALIEDAEGRPSGFTYVNGKWV